MELTHTGDFTMGKARIKIHEIDNVGEWYEKVRPTEWQRPYGLKFSQVMTALENASGADLEDLFEHCDTMVREDVLEESLARLLHNMKVNGADRQTIKNFCWKMENLSAYAFTPHGIECAKKVAQKIR
jgi:hypothetical protein